MCTGGWEKVLNVMVVEQESVAAAEVVWGALQ
jgi:hypothetical protein